MVTPTPPSWATFSAARRSRLAAALWQLQEAAADARALDRDDWEFALTIRELLDAGLAGTDVRWLVAHGFARHAVERFPSVEGRRVFRPAPDLSITERSSFVLTPAGARFIGDLALAVPEGGEPERPRWDGLRRELTWQAELVKRFRTPARCQETILAAFEEEGWPPRIDDPLRGDGHQDPQQRLHNAVRCLNRNQLDSHIRFSRDGTGEGVCWEG